MRLQLKPRGGRQCIMGFITLLWVPPAPADRPNCWNSGPRKGAALQRAILPLIFLLLAALAAPAQLPEFYKNVHQLTWVVKDVEAVAGAWARLGLNDIERHGEVTIPVEYRGSKALTRVRWTRGRLGAVCINMYQPVEGTNAWSEFLGRHGDGVMSLLYLAPSREAFEREAERLRTAGVRVLQRGAITAGGRTLNYTYLDTEPQGKYVLGLMYDSHPASLEASPAAAPSVRIIQFAFVIDSLPPVSAYWKKLGFPEFEVTHPALTGLFYKGQPAKYEQDLGWQKHGAVPFEWCVPPADSPTVYAEYLKTHGEGVQHIAFEVSDMDQAIARYKQLGFETVQGGGWGQDGKPGSGRFGYVDTERVGGLTIELLWNYRQK